MRLPLFALFFLCATLSAAPDGAALFVKRCAVCHQENTGPGIPTRAQLAVLDATKIMETLQTGVMVRQAAGLSEDELRAIALYLNATRSSTSVLHRMPGHCSGETKPFQPGLGDWNGWGVDLNNSRYQPRPGLSAADIPRPQLKWAFGFPGDTRAAGQPAISGGRVFVGSNGGAVYSLDASTGCFYWYYETGGAAVHGAVTVAQLPGSQRWLAFFGDAHGTAHALDAQTGQSLWSTKIDDHPAARVTGSPVYFMGRLYVPASSGEETLESSTPGYACCKFRGSLSALDAATGRVLWKTYTVSNEAKPYKTRSNGEALYGPAGAGIWSAPTIDQKRGRIYVATGNSYTGVEIPTSDAILALDLETGKMVWWNQVTPGDNWVPSCMRHTDYPDNPGEDFDFGSSPVLQSLGGEKDILIAAQKSGVVYGLDPDQKGKIVWKTRIGQGGALVGGVAWGAAADRQRVYAAVGDAGSREPGTPGLYALRIGDGERVWSAPAPARAGNPAQAAAVSAMPGIVFSGSFGGHLRAYSTSTGEIIWDYDAVRLVGTVNLVSGRGGSFNGGGPAIGGGLVVATSGYGFAGGLPGNVLLAFSVEGK